MTAERVDELLRGYRVNAARVEHLTREIAMLERDIARAERGLAEDLAAVRPQQITDMPHGTAISNPTEKLALMLVGGWEPEDLKHMRARLAAMVNARERAQAEAAFVDVWLKALPERERFVVTAQTIDRLPWDDVREAYQGRFGEASKDTLKRLRARGMEIIYEIAVEKEAGE